MPTSSKERLKQFAARAIQDHRRAWGLRLIARLARFYNYSWEYPNFEIAENGERSLLRALASQKMTTVFDVGANVGDWSAECAVFFKHASIHAFEPVPETYSVLARRLTAGSPIVAHPFGLSDSNGPAEFTYYGPDNSFLSTLSTPIHDHLPSSRVEIRLRRGDEIMRELGLPQVDFLKIDVEGMEYEVLEGFSRALAGGNIGMIQFEKQPGRRLLKDYYRLLDGLHYRVGKIYSRYVDFRPYDSAQERTAGPNYLAIPSLRADLIAELQNGFAPGRAR